MTTIFDKLLKDHPELDKIVELRAKAFAQYLILNAYKKFQTFKQLAECQTFAEKKHVFGQMSEYEKRVFFHVDPKLIAIFGTIRKKFANDKFPTHIKFTNHLIERVDRWFKSRAQFVSSIFYEKQIVWHRKKHTIRHKRTGKKFVLFPCVDMQLGLLFDFCNPTNQTHENNVNLVNYKLDDEETTAERKKLFARYIRQTKTKEKNDTSNIDA